MNRAERLTAEGEGRRGNVVGFALTILQRRLASSPRRSTARLSAAASAWRAACRGGMRKRGADAQSSDARATARRRAHRGFRRRTTSMTCPRANWRSSRRSWSIRHLPRERSQELEAEIDRPHAGLTTLAEQVRASGTDRKWEELRSLLQDTPEMFDADGSRRKLIIFTEHRDTLNYLVETAAARCWAGPRPWSIHGGMGREERRKAQEAFTQDKDVPILVATDAAGEGINLQRAHLMVNYDLPWNPNRIEQRFGRIHRIGQTEVCHLWNLVAEDTREGAGLPAAAREAGGAAQGARRQGVRRARRGVPRHVSPRDASRRDPLWGTPGHQSPA